MPIKALVPNHLLAELRPLADVLQVTLVPYDRNGVPESDSQGAEVLFRYWLSSEHGDRLIDQHPGLRWIHTGSVGVDHILTPAFLKTEITLTNAAGIGAVSIAEWTVAAMLALQKGLRQVFEQQAARKWEKIERDELSGGRVIILGAGRVATEIATRLRSFGLRLICVRRQRQPHPLFDETQHISNLPELVRNADWIIITLPLTAETRGLVNEQLLRNVPRSCRLVNVARGEIVDEAALLAALQEGRLGGAALDVFAQEPLPSSHPFWSAPELIVIPHASGNSPQVRAKRVELFGENLRRYVKGQPLLNVVNVAAGY